MKTYAEENNTPTFDWNEKLDALIAGEVISPEALKELEDLSSSWVTCACGNQCAIIPRDKEDGHPLDLELWGLGVSFWGKIYPGQWGKAKEVLKKIETRSAFLIKEILNEKN